MNIQQIHDFIDLISSKERNAFFSAEEKDTSLGAASQMVFNDQLAKYATSIAANEALAPFKKRLDFETDSEGVYTIASDQSFSHLLNFEVLEMHATYGLLQHRVKVVNEDEISERQSSVLHKPTISNPCAIVTGVGAYQFYPKQTLAGTVSFFKNPTPPKLAQTQSGRTFTYDAAGSTQLEWTEAWQYKVIYKALVQLGINLSEDKLVSYSDALSK